MRSAEFYASKLLNENSMIKKVGWDNELKARDRYRKAIDLIGPCSEQITIVDVGCGLGNLYNEMIGSGLNFEYIGIDIEPWMVGKAKEYGLKQKVILSTVEEFTSTLKENVDVFVSLGAYTIMDDAIPEYRIFTEIDLMLQFARKKVIVNGFHKAVDFEDSFFYHDLHKLVKFAQGYSETHRISIHIFEKHEFFMVFEVK